MKEFKVKKGTDEFIFPRAPRPTPHAHWFRVQMKDFKGKMGWGIGDRGLGEWRARGAGSEEWDS